MDWKLAFSTFTLIFVAELGDKTQLAAFAATAGGRSPWSVFAGAASALVLSTLLAVLLGDTIQRFVPTHYLKFAAGILFVVFGIWLIAATAIHRQVAVSPPSVTPANTLVRMVLSAALDFEEASAERYDTMADTSDDPAVRRILSALADEERAHLQALRNTLTEQDNAPWNHEGLGPAEALIPSVAVANPRVREALEKVITHELATASFYDELARTAPLGTLKTVFSGLASQERAHADRLRNLASSRT